MDSVGISVIVPLFNKRETVSRAIESVLANGFAPVELIVTDDGSTDGSDQVVAGFGERVRYIRQDNAGPSAARNRGARLAKYPWFMFLDADDEFLPGCLADHAEARSLGVDLSVMRARIVEPDGSFSDQPSGLGARALRHAGRFFVADGFRESLAIGVHLGCIDADLFWRIGGFDETLRCWEVSDLMLRAASKARSIGVLPDVGVAVYQREGGQFSQTKANLLYQGQFAEKVLEIMSTLPHEERGLVRTQMLGAVHAYWRAGMIREFKSLGSRAGVHLRAAGIGGRRLAWLASMPEGVLTCLNRILVPDARCSNG